VVLAAPPARGSLPLQSAPVAIQGGAIPHGVAPGRPRDGPRTVTAAIPPPAGVHLGRRVRPHHGKEALT